MRTAYQLVSESPVVLRVVIAVHPVLKAEPAASLVFAVPRGHPPDRPVAVGRRALGRRRGRLRQHEPRILKCHSFANANCKIDQEGGRISHPRLLCSLSPYLDGLRLDIEGMSEAKF